MSWIRRTSQNHSLSTTTTGPEVKVKLLFALTTVSSDAAASFVLSAGIQGIGGVRQTTDMYAGTHSIRAGFSNAAAPHVARQSQITKYRDRKSNKQVTLFGEDVDLDAQARANVKSMWDGEALINGEVLVSDRLSVNRADTAQESTLDCTFLQLGIDTDSIQHPVIMSEKLANPLYCRACEFLAVWNEVRQLILQ